MCPVRRGPADLFASLTATRPFDESTLDIPLGSGRTKVSKFEVNAFIEFERVRDWWGADLRSPRS